MAKRERAEYFRQYYPQRKLRDAVRAKLAVDPVCQVCNWQFATVYWGPRSIYSCKDCATKLSEWDGTWRPKAEAAAKAENDLWSGPKAVHIFEKGTQLDGPVASGSLCGVQAPEGPIKLEMLQPKELKRWPLCFRCQMLYTDPVALAERDEQFFGYAIPAPAQDEVPVT